MRKYLAAFTFIALAVLVARPAAAQGDEFYGGIGVGYGAYDLSASGFTLPSAYKNDGAVYAEFGYRVSQRFALGVEADYYITGNYSSKPINGATFKVWYYNVAAAIYPFGASQMWLKVLAGFANTTGDVDFSGSGSSPSQGGYDMGLGLGYDIRFGHGDKFAIVPFAQYLAQLAGGTPSGSASSVKYKSNLFVIGAGIAFIH
jgi:hypothetical protein